MAVTIKLKNASGSDPTASDLVVGELAIRTDNGKIFTKRDNGNVTEITGGGGIDDGDKGDITVSNSGATFTIDDDAVTYAKIQNVSATNRILGRDSSGAGVIEEITPANLRTMINVEDGATADQSASDILSLLSDQNIATTGSLTIGTDIIHSGDTDTKISFTTDQVAIDTGGTSRLTISDSAIQHSLNTTVAGTFTMSHTNGNFAVNNAAGSDVFTVNSSSGNVTTSGTVDGRDLAADGTKLDGIASGATNVTNTNQLTNGAGFITATLTNEQVQDIVGGMVSGNTETGITVTYQDGDGTLDFVVGTLNQDTTGSSASCTGNSATATKLATARTIAGVSFDGSANISLNNNAITNGAGYITATLTNEQVQDIVGGMVSGNTESGITVTYQDGDGTLDFSVASQTDENFTTTLKNKLDGIAAGATNVTNNNQLTNGAGYITSASDSTKLPLSGGELTGDLITHQVRPDGNNTRSLGTDSFRWSNVFTNDLHLSNKGGANKIDNSWGDFTIQEGSDDLFLINNRNGKMFKFLVEEVN